MDDLDYKDLFRDAIHTIAYIARAAGFDPNDPTVEPPAIIARVENQRADLERLTAEHAALLARAEGVDLEEVLDAWSLVRDYFAIPSGKVGYLVRTAPALAREVARLRAALEETRFTLAAEQGKPEGAPSEGWTFDGEWRCNDALADRVVERTDDSDPDRRWCATIWTGPEDAIVVQEIWAPTARAAMKDVDATVKP